MQSQAPAPAQAVTVPQTAGTPTAPPSAATAREMYLAIRQQRRVLTERLAAAERDRDDIAGELRLETVTGADRSGLEARIQDADARIADLRTQLRSVESQEVTAAGVPGSMTPTRYEERSDRAEVFFGLGFALTFVVILPLSIAYARRLWKKKSVVVTLPQELTTRLEAIEQAVETTAVEVERIGEGQRFVTQLLAARQVEAQLPSQTPR